MTHIIPGIMIMNIIPWEDYGILYNMRENIVSGIKQLYASLANKSTYTRRKDKLITNL